jgi:hypothetical protein
MHAGASPAVTLNKIDTRSSARLAGRSSSNPIRWRPKRRPRTEEDTGDRIQARKGLTRGGPLNKPVLFKVVKR